MGLFKSIAKIAAPGLGTLLGGAVGGSIGSGISQAIGANDAQDFAKDQLEDQLEWSREQFDKNAALQREFAQHGVRWRVEDARAAGVHPLFALGAGGAAAAPITMSFGGSGGGGYQDWKANLGQDLGRAITAQMDPMQRRLQEAQLKVLESEASKNNALALAAAGSKRATSDQPGQVPFPDVNLGPVDMTGFMNQAVIKPVEVYSQSSAFPGVAAGPSAPGMFVYNFGGQPVLLPGNSVDQALEALSESPLLMGITYKLNVRHFGEPHMDQFMRDNVPFGSEALGVRDFIRGIGEFAAGPSARRAIEAADEVLDRQRRTVRGKIRYREYPTPWGPYKGIE